MTSGRYTFEREIGRGASGAVRLGRDTLLGRDVALKRVGYVPGGTSPEEVRAEREARIAASLSHPHLVGVYDLVHVGDSFWLVMEYVDGTSLSSLVASEGALSPDRARRLIGQLADALALVHSHGVVHRDVKPSNVLVANVGSHAETAKLTDFGIARGEDDRALTQTGLVTGSPAYLSPEVVTGGRATQASDVWAVGATLFHLLAGRPPYDTSENVLSTMYRIVNEAPPRLETDARLAEVIENTLVIDPAARWSAERVRDHLVGRPTRDGAAPAPVPAPAHSRAAHSSAVHVPTVPASTVSSPTESTVAARRLVESAESRPLWNWVVVAGLVTACTVLAFVWGFSGGGDADDTPSPSTTPRAIEPAERPGASDEPSESPDPSDEPVDEPPVGVTSDDLDAFARSYLVAAPNDPASAWNRLTPEFQNSSGGFDGYTSWWNQVSNAEALDVRSDPESLQVSYTVRYTLTSGRTSTENVRLRLEDRDGTLLIAGEG